ncbi:hypothetical protein Pcinc_032904 [Petrolisthes cinctipes]|uniref:Uncharacterized protein n=1 Tax=Petrolisthes cinctipes TaxID=88211 RepID=A0AAE1ET54_PETCI|nr:hypothetical protein Pcinc_032904 [Petrolisthes cinctipes]
MGKGAGRGRGMGEGEVGEWARGKRFGVRGSVGRGMGMGQEVEEVWGKRNGDGGRGSGGGLVGEKVVVLVVDDRWRKWVGCGSDGRWAVVVVEDGE